MLYINNKRVYCADDAGIPDYFGTSDQQDPRTAKIIDWYIENPRRKDFDSTEDFARKVMKHLRTKYLPIKCTHINYPGPYIIKMSGSRAKDADKANKKAGLSYTPGGYTWHHHENVTYYSPDKIKCAMYLIDSDYHSFPHSGGVKEYEAYTGRTYK